VGGGGWTHGGEGRGKEYLLTKKKNQATLLGKLIEKHGKICYYRRKRKNLRLREGLLAEYFRKQCTTRGEKRKGEGKEEAESQGDVREGGDSVGISLADPPLGGSGWSKKGRRKGILSLKKREKRQSINSAKKDEKKNRDQRGGGGRREAALIKGPGYRRARKSPRIAVDRGKITSKKEEESRSARGLDSEKTWSVRTAPGKKRVEVSPCNCPSGAKTILKGGNHDM